MLRTLSYETTRNLLSSVTNTVGATTVSSFGYTHDEAYRRTHTTFSGSAFAQSVFDHYAHNDRAEVTAAAQYLGTDIADFDDPVAAYNYGFAYDPIGNRQSSSTAETGTSVGTTYTPDELNQYTSIVEAGTPPVTITPGHDDDGNQTTLDNPTGSWTVSWDAENRLVETVSDTTKVECKYDYRSRRVEKRVSTSADGGTTWTVTSIRRFLYDGWTLIAEFDATVGVSLDRTHLWGTDLGGTPGGAGGIGGLLRTRIYSPTGFATYYPTYDANGNVSEYMDSSGTVVAHYEYAPFGGVTAATGTMAASFAFRYSTKYLDTETALWYYGYRYYDPQAGRWMSRDPIGVRGGANVWAFVRNHPLTLLDVLGLQDAGLNGGADDYPPDQGKPPPNEIDQTVEAVNLFLLVEGEPGDDPGTIGDERHEGGGPNGGTGTGRGGPLPGSFGTAANGSSPTCGTSRSSSGTGATPSGPPANGGQSSNGTGAQAVAPQGGQAQPQAQCPTRQPAPRNVCTGRTTPQSLAEQLAMEQVKAKPSGTTPPRMPKMSDTKNNLLDEDGWKKRVQNVNGVEIHYVENINTGEVLDFKFKD